MFFRFDKHNISSTCNAMLNAMTANWEQADSDMSNLKNVWNLYKNIVPEEQRELSSQLDYSIQEFEKVLSERTSRCVT